MTLEVLMAVLSHLTAGGEFSLPFLQATVTCAFNHRFTSVLVVDTLPPRYCFDAENIKLTYGRPKLTAMWNQQRDDG
jgi:hypothetical protein